MLSLRDENDGGRELLEHVCRARAHDWVAGHGLRDDYELQRADSSKAEATDLAKGIGEALIATGGGLLLAIPSMFLYFFFRGQVSTNMADVHRTLSHILDLFTGEAQGSPPSARQELAAQEFAPQEMPDQV